MTRVLLIFRSGTYPIVHIWISIPNQLYYEIMFVYFFIHLDVQRNCVFVKNLSCPSVIQHTNNNHTSVYIVLFIKFDKPGFVSIVKESHRRIISYLLTNWVILTLCMSHLTMYCFLNDFPGWVLDRVTFKLLSNSIPFLVGLYSPFSDEIMNPGCVWYRV